MSDNEIYPINIHGEDGKLMLSVAFNSVPAAESLLQRFSEYDREKKFRVIDDFGHNIVIKAGAIGFMIYVDQAKDAELGKIIDKRMMLANIKDQARKKLVSAN